MKRNLKHLFCIIIITLLIYSCGTSRDFTINEDTIQSSEKEGNRILSDAEELFLHQYFSSLKYTDPSETIAISDSVQKKWEKLRGGDPESIFVTDVFYRDETDIYMALVQKYPEKITDGTDLWYHLLHLQKYPGTAYMIYDDVLLDYYKTERKEAEALVRQAYLKYRKSHPVSSEEIKERMVAAQQFLADRLELSAKEKDRLISYFDAEYNEDIEKHFLPGVLLTDSFILHDSVKEAGTSQENWLDALYFRIGYKDTDEDLIKKQLIDLFGTENSFYDIFVTRNGDSLKADIVLFYPY